jgi:hypothetical protein
MSDTSSYGQESTLGASAANLRINIEDQVVKYPDWQFPLLKRWNSSIFKKDVLSHKYEWSEREMRPQKAKVASATVADSATTFYVDTPGVFNVDDVLQKPDGEQVIVKAVAGGTLLTVEHWTGTAESMALNDVVMRIGVAAPQGKDADDMVIQGMSDLYNYTQILEDVIHLSGTQRNALIRGDETQGELVSRKQMELLQVLQSTLILGRRAINVGDKRYTMGGMKYFIDTYASTNAIDFGGSWATDATVLGKFEDAVEAIANNNGQKPTIYMGYAAMRKFRMINDDLIKTDRTDSGRGIGVVTNYLSQLGQLDIVLLNDPAKIFQDLIFFVDESKVGYKAMRNRGWFTEELAKTGDSYKWQVLGEYTAKFETPKIMSYLYNLGL